MGDGSGRTTPWYADRGTLARFVGDLMSAAATRLRPGVSTLPPPPWPADCFIDERGLGLDSLERLSVASELAEALHLTESGVADLLLARRRFGQWCEVAADGLTAHAEAISFRTSGSTGEPRTHRHALAELTEEVDHHAAALAGCRRVWSAVPAHHIYGFVFTVLLPGRLGVPVLDARAHTPQRLGALLRAGDLLVSHPLHWGLMLRFAAAIPAGVVGVTSTAACPRELAQDLARAGLERLVQVYGSTETGGIGRRESPDGPYRLLPFWARSSEQPGCLERTAPAGSRRLHEAPDELTWLDAQCFHVRRRLDAAVQVAGFNVYPSRVREVLLQHPAVREAAVRRMRAGEGERLKAFVVPRDGADWRRLPRELQRWIGSRLTVGERPASFTLGRALPLDSSGKPADWSPRRTGTNPTPRSSVALNAPAGRDI